MVKLTAIQLSSSPDVEQNLSVIDYQLGLLPPYEHHLVVLPECCLFFGGSEKEQLALAKKTSTQQYLQSSLAQLVKKHQVTLVAGSIPVLVENKNCSLSLEDKYTNSSFIFSPEGKLLTRYDKIHLFDVSVDDNEKTYLESRYTQAGDKPVTCQTHFAKIGLSICYDLRFPELFRQLRSLGAEVIVVPSAFTKVTGKAHWQTLLQARAIENQVYIVAAGQVGQHKNGRETWGHSMIISPWGEVLSELPDEVGSVSADFCQKELISIRKTMPIQQHNKFKTELISYE